MCLYLALSSDPANPLVSTTSLCLDLLNIFGQDFRPPHVDLSCMQPHRFIRNIHCSFTPTLRWLLSIAANLLSFYQWNMAPARQSRLEFESKPDMVSKEPYSSKQHLIWYLICARSICSATIILIDLILKHPLFPSYRCKTEVRPLLASPVQRVLVPHFGM